MKELLEKTQEYLDYIKAHYEAVQAAWVLIQAKCSDMPFVADTAVRNQLDEAVRDHDMSKLTSAEFVPYRLKFFPTQAEKDSESMVKLTETLFQEAWQHHQHYNDDHHWQTWTKTSFRGMREKALCCVHMVIDWTAMAMQRGNPYGQYYRENKDNIKIPEWSHALVSDIFKRLEG